MDCPSLLTPPNCLSYVTQFHSKSLLYIQNQLNFCTPTSGYGYECQFNLPLLRLRSFAPLYRNHKKKRGYNTISRASRRESPYELLGISPTATVNEIKRAYRKLALKYHPDVNKQANAQEKFMRIKHAYNTLLNSDSRRKFDSGNSSSDFSYSTSQRDQSRKSEDDEDFYGFDDFFRDLQGEFRNWEGNASSQAKPKSLWEELAEIGEEFVEFLEKELNIVDSETEANKSNEVSNRGNPVNDSRTRERGGGSQDEAGKGSSIEDNLDEIEATLAQLKKELGL